LNTATGNVERWTESESAIDTSAFPEAELIRWKSFDGKTISGFLYRPPAKFGGKRPVLVNIHGGPEGQSIAGFIGRNNYLLNELGIAIVFPNVRGSDGYGKSFLKLDNGFLREDSYKDIDALFDWIATRSDLDSSRIAVTGGSYGGHMTLAISTIFSDRIRCAIDVVGMSNLVTFLEHTEAYRRDLRRVEYGDERDPTMRAFLEKIAPMNNLSKIRKPMFVIAGKNDPRVPVSESDQIVAALKKQGTPVWYLMAKDEGHGFQKKANADYQFYATIVFLQQHLLN
jgi:dipeptidyl aminopeptidase/acylaminoacyl peptidase